MVEFQVEGNTWTFDSVPDECPICHRGIDPRFLAGVVRSSAEMEEADVELVFQCPRRDCARAFIGRYRGLYDQGLGDYLMELRGTAPHTPPAAAHPDEVAAVSPRFVSAVAQARAAEAWGLGELAGCGYRRALEFLVRDFCARRSPADVAAIRRKALGHVIEDHVDDPGVRECARRAAWLENDEAHEPRRWQEKDIALLKDLLALTESWVNTALLASRLLGAPPD